MTDKPMVRRALENKTQLPEYKKRDIDPPMGGRSLLHDEHGIPKVSANPKSKGDIPMMKEIPNEPVAVQASEVENSAQVSMGVPRRGAPVTSENEDKFFPPKSNFVNVGAVEQSWHSEEVTGIPDEPMIDNNDEVDVESMQGSFHNDLEDNETTQLKAEWSKRMDLVRANVIAELSRVSTYDEYEDLKSKVFGRSGVIARLAKQFKNIKASHRSIIGPLTNELVDSLSMEFQTVESEFDDEPQMQEDHATPEDVAKAKSPAFDLQEGQYCVIVRGVPVKVLNSKKEAQLVLSKILLGNNVDLKDVELITRVSIDFGVLIGD